MAIYGSALGSAGAPASVNVATPKQPTVAGALGSIDSLNDRLSVITNQLAAIANAVGGPYPAGGIAGETASKPEGIVYRLNESADAAHRRTTEIEELIGAISRALG